MATPVQVASGTLDSAGANTVALAYTSANTAGNFLAAAVTWDVNSGGSTLTATDSAGNTWTVHKIQIDTDNGQGSALAYAPNCKAGANTLTFHFTGTAKFRLMQVEEWPGVANTSPADGTPAGATASGTTASNNITSGAMTTSTDGDLVIGVLNLDDGQAATVTAGTGFTRDIEDVTTGVSLAMEHQTQATHGSIAGTWTQSASGRYNAIVAAFKAAPAPPHSGSASGSYSWAGAASGEAPEIPEHSGTVSGSYGWTGIAAGIAGHHGAATGATAWAGTASGTSPIVAAHTGTAEGSISWIGAASGSRPMVPVHSGTASGRADWVGAVSGHVDHSGTAVGEINWRGAVSEENNVTLLAAYSFDDATSSSCTDDSGNGHTATGHHDGVTVVAGHTGNGVQSTDVDAAAGYYLVDRAGLEPAAITVMGWFNPATVDSAWRSGITKSQDGASDTAGIYVTKADGTGLPGFNISTANGSATPSDVTPLTAGSWAHLAGTYDGSDAKFYVNGDLVDTVPATGDLLYDATMPWSILDSFAFENEIFDGVADDIRIYDAALDGTTIQSLMDTPVTPPASNGTLTGVAATANSMSIAVAFEASSVVWGDAPTATSEAIPGAFNGTENGMLTGSIAAATSAAMPGSFNGAVNGVLIGAIAAAVSAGVPGALAASAVGGLSGVLATATSVAFNGAFVADGAFAGAAARATSRSFAGSLAGHLSFAALIVGAVTGPALSHVPAGPNVAKGPAATGPSTRVAGDGPATSTKITGPQI